MFSIEVLEHIPMASHEEVFNFIVASVAPGGVLVIGVAHPGQHGHGHMSLLPRCVSQTARTLLLRSRVRASKATSMLLLSNCSGSLDE